MNPQRTCRLKMIQDGAALVPRTCPTCGLFGDCKKGLHAVPKSALEPDPITANLAALDSLEPGDSVVLPTGERWVYRAHSFTIQGRKVSMGFWLLNPRGSSSRLSADDHSLRPLLKTAIAGGAVVVKGGQE